MEVQELDGSFADPVLQAQAAFRALMDALANPGKIQPLGVNLTPPRPLLPELAAVALTLCDHDTQIWLAQDLTTDAVIGWLRFHAGAPLTPQRDQAKFALTRDAETLILAGFGQGTDLYPDRSTTIALAIEALSGGETLSLAGPGIAGSIEIAPRGLPPDFLAQWAENGALFPRGVDLLLLAGGAVLGLPRTTRITKKDA